MTGRQAHRGPPPLARAVLRLACPTAEYPEVDGDFLEAFVHRARHRGTRSAVLRYWREVVLFCFWRIRRRLREIRTAPGGPTARPLDPRDRGPSPRRPRLVADAIQDLRYAARALGRSPGFSAIALLILALGIGANATMFTLANAIFLEPPPHVESPDRLVGITRITDQFAASSLGYPDYEFYRDNNEVFSGVLAYMSSPFVTSVGSGDEISRAEGWLVSGNFFEVLGVHPAQGRWFAPEEDEEPGAHAVAVVSHGFWQRYLGGDRGAVGKSIFLNGRRFTVVGVTPEGFRGMSPVEVPPDIYVPIMMRDAVTPGYGQWYRLVDGEIDMWLRLVARLQPGVDLETAAAHLTLLRERWKREFAPWIEATEPQPFRLGVTRQYQFQPSTANRMKNLITILFGVVGAVLLIASANIAILLLARASGRGREMGIRAALGAGRGRVVRQLLTEGMVLSLAGGVGGYFLAHLGARLAANLFPYSFSVDFAPDATVLAATFAVCIGAALLFGLAPAWQLSRTDLQSTLLRGMQQARRTPLRNALVVGQIAVSIVLVIGAGLFVRSFRNAEAVDFGFDPHRRLLMAVQLGNYGYDQERGLQFTGEVLEHINALPGVEGASVTGMVPFRGEWGSTVTVPGTEYAETGFDSGFNRVGPGYFRTMGIPIVAGREFMPTDDAFSMPVIIVNEKVAEELWPGQNALGKTVVRGERQHTVIGIAGNATYYHIGEDRQSQMYLAYFQDYGSRAAFLVHTSADPRTVTGGVELVIRDRDPRLAIYAVSTLDELIAGEVGQYRVMAILVSLFGSLALLLAVVGLYGVQSFLVAQRAKEIGVRMALGALHRQIAGAVLGRGVALTACGVVVGVVTALAMARVIEGLLFGLEAVDPLTFVSVSAALFAAAGVASLVPAVRASRVDPVEVLREE